MMADECANMEFMFTTKHGSLLKSIVESGKDILICINLIVNEKGAFIIQRNRPKTCQVAVSLLAINFDFFHCRPNEEYRISLDGISFFRNLKILYSSDSISFIKFADQNAVRIQSSNDEKRAVHQMNIPILEEEFDVLRLKDIPLDEYSFILSSSRFSKILKDLKSLNVMEVTIELELNKLSIVGAAEYSDVRFIYGVSPQLKFNPNLGKVLQGGPPISAKFDLRLLVLFLKAGSVNNEIKFYLTRGAPLILRYENELGNMLFYATCLCP